MDLASDVRPTAQEPEAEMTAEEKIQRLKNCLNGSEQRQKRHVSRAGKTVCRVIESMEQNPDECASVRRTIKLMRNKMVTIPNKTTAPENGTHPLDG